MLPIMSLLHLTFWTWTLYGAAAVVVGTLVIKSDKKPPSFVFGWALIIAGSICEVIGVICFWEWVRLG